MLATFPEDLDLEHAALRRLHCDPLDQAADDLQRLRSHVFAVQVSGLFRQAVAVGFGVVRVQPGAAASGSPRAARVRPPTLTFGLAIRFLGDLPRWP